MKVARINPASSAAPVAVAISIGIIALGIVATSPTKTAALPLPAVGAAIERSHGLVEPIPTKSKTVVVRRVGPAGGKTFVARKTTFSGPKRTFTKTTVVGPKKTFTKTTVIGPKGTLTKTTIIGRRGPNSNFVIRRAGFRPIYIGPGYIVRDRWWPRGGAILAGAAVGFIVAGTAIAWAGPPPGPEYCWYYTNPDFQEEGFWDYCP